MKLLVVLSALVAVCAAKPGYLGGHAVAVGHAVPLADHVPAALNGLTPHGTPIDTPAVQHARAAHLAAVGVAYSHAYAAPHVYAPAVPTVVGAHGYAGVAPVVAGVHGVVAPYAGVHGVHYG